MEVNVTYIKAVNAKNPVIKVADLFKIIKYYQENKSHIDLIDKIRDEVDKDKRKTLKILLPALALSVIFEGGLAKKDIKYTTEVLFLDFDFESINDAFMAKADLIKLLGYCS